MKPRIIALEGPECAGKTSTVARLQSALPERKVMTFRFPGTTPLGERIRSLAHDATVPSCSVAQWHLFMADRWQAMLHLFGASSLQFEPGTLIVFDRFELSTLVHQVMLGAVPEDVNYMHHYRMRRAFDIEWESLILTATWDVVNARFNAREAANPRASERFKDADSRRVQYDAWAELRSSRGIPSIDTSELTPDEVLAATAKWIRSRP